MRFLYSFELYKDFFIKDLNNTIYFPDVATRETYFQTMSPSNKILFTTQFNYIQDRQSVRVSHNPGVDHIEISKCTYGKFYNDKQTFYFNIINTEYINDQVTIVNFIIDPFVTFVNYGNLNTIFNQAFNTQIERQHFNTSNYNLFLRELTHNEDILYSGTNDYAIHQELYRFDQANNQYYVMFQSAVKMDGGVESFGTVDAPLFPSATGSVVNRVSSPVDIYIMTAADFKTMMNNLVEFPWITQNFIKITQLPADFVLDTGLDVVSAFDGLYRFKDGALTPDKAIMELSFTWQQLADIFDCDLATEKHLMRYPYCYITMQTWDGQSVEIHLEDIENPNGLSIMRRAVIGYHNQIMIYPDMMNTIGENLVGSAGRGDFLNNSIVVDNFDDVPVLVDNYQLGLAKNAHQRALAQSKLITNRAKNIATGTDMKSRIFDVVSVISNFSPLALGEKITDEYEYYRTLNAEMNDAKITQPTLTNQTYSNNFQIKEEIFGITMKFRKVSPQLFNNVRKYHKLFGFALPYSVDRIQVDTMTRANYLKAKLNNFKVPGVDSKISDILKLRVENGIRIWKHPVSNGELDNNIMV